MATDQMSPAASDDDPANDDPERADVPKMVRSIPVVDDRIDSRDVFIGTREVIIRHGDETYRLRLTMQNKLILTK
ncbi:MAG TPA: hemin uptake protein HemP [Xanthobacteraceae bacterium]|nr:hemin uptake protein HemP [Xanthobacteraceae bacterium]